jgi:RHS repeat-associated protein
MLTGKNEFNFSKVSIFGKKRTRKNNNRRQRAISAHADEPNRRRKIIRFLTSRLFAQRALSLLIILSLLAQTTPAMHISYLTIASELKNDLVYSLGSSPFLAFIKSSMKPGSVPKKDETSQKSISQIQILPAISEMIEGDRIAFTALGIDSEGNTVSGVKFAWSCFDLGANQASPISRNGIFKPTYPSDYKITASGGGLKAEFQIKVKPGINSKKRGERPTDEVTVSTQTTGATPSEMGTKPTSNDDQNQPTSLAPDDNGWNPGNYGDSDSPGNTIGNPPGAPGDEGAGSGNFQLITQILDMQTRGSDISLKLAYNSRLWAKSGNNITYDIDKGFPAPGWNLGFGKMILPGGNSGAMIVEPDGTRHSYTGTVTTYGTSQWFTGYTTDGSFIDYGYSGYNGYTTGYASLPNGTRVNYGAGYDWVIYPTDITDANGNTTIITYVNNQGPRISTITDPMGRVIQFHYDYNNLLTAITAPGLGGGAARTLVRLKYRQIGLSYQFYGLYTHVRNSYPFVLDAIYYPATNSGYWFGDGDSYSSYGMLAKVVEQRGMGFSAGSLNDQGTVYQGAMTKQQNYNYPLSPVAGLTDAPTYTTMTDTWTKDGVNNEQAVTNYLVQTNQNPRKITITSPNGLKSIQYSYYAPNQWYDGLIYLDETRGAGDVLLNSSSVSWAQGNYYSPRPVSVSSTNEFQQATRKDFTYGSTYNQVTSARDYGYGGEMLREVRTQYVTDANYTYNHIFNLPSVVETYNGDGATRVARTEITYDEEAENLADTPGVINHYNSYNPHAPQYWVDPYCIEYDPYYGYCSNWGGGYYESEYNAGTAYRGLVTKIKSYADPTYLDNNTAETEIRRYDITGNMIYAGKYCDPATVCENVYTTYSSATQYAYPQSVTRGSPSTPNTQVTTSTNYDFNTGVVLNLTDANGRVSTTDYAPATLRPNWTSTPYRYGNAGYTRFIYDDNALSITETVYTAEHVVASQNIKYLNGHGKVRLERALGSGGVYDAVETYFDNLDQVVQQSRPHKETEAAQLVTVNYDLIGRPVKVTSPDGSFTENFYNEGSRPNVASGAAGQTVRTKDAWGREHWERTDAQGRLVEIVEPNPAGDGTVASGGLVTNYQYDTLDNLTQSNQGGQLRYFRYDGLGRLTHQKLAEKNATLNDAGQYVGGGTWSDVIGYDNRSNVNWRIDARGVKSVFSYGNDPLNRLQSVSYDTSGFGDWANPVAAAATVSYGYRQRGSAGELTDTTQIASVTVAGVSTETYAFDGESRVSDITFTFASRPSQPLTASYLYDTLDRNTQARYPKQYGVGGEPRKVVDQQFDAASRLSTLTVDNVNFASQIQYNAASQATSLQVGSQITENYAYNAQTGLLEQQTVVRNGSTQLLNLSYDYKNASNKSTGQLRKITNNLDASGAHNRSYSYDALGRLTQATGGNSGSPIWSQNYAYDRFGNRTGVSASGNSAGSTPPSCAPSQTLSLNQFIQDFYQRSLNRQPTAGELSSWASQLRQAYWQGPYQLIQASAAMGRVLFQSQEYANRGRTNSEYVYDLYWAYLRRTPDQGGWDFWTAQVAATSRPAVHEGFPYSQEFANVASTVCPSGAGAGAPIPADGIASLSYDAASNRINTGGYYYDANGNQTRVVKADGSVQRFYYDAANRMTKVTNDWGGVLQYIGYAEDNERIITQNGDSHDRTYYFGDDAEYYESANNPSTFRWSKSYISSGDRLFAVVRDNGGGGETTDFYHPDRLGTRLITNQATGSSLEQQTLPFGTPLENETTGSSNRRFTTYDRSNVTGLDYAQNRTYDAQQGRFTQVDPIGMKAVSLENPQTLNLYNYVGNDPVNRTDPTGLFWGKLFRFLKKLIRIVAIAAAVALAIVLVFTAVIAPTLVNIIMAIGAVANALSQITAALGYTNVSRVFRIIGALADIGNTALQFVQAVRAAANAAANAVAKAVIKAIQTGIALATKVLDLFGVSRLSNILKLAGSIIGFIDTKAYQRGKRSVWQFAFDLFKFGRSVASRVAAIAGSAAATRFIDLLGVIEDGVDIFMQIKTPIPPVPTSPSITGLPRPMVGSKIWKVANIIGRGMEIIRKAVAATERIQRFAR